MRRPIQPTDRPLEPTPTSSLLSCTPIEVRRSLQTLRWHSRWINISSALGNASGSNPSVWLCGKSTSDPLPSGGLTKNSSSFATPTVTQDVTQSVNHQLAPLCQPSGALFILCTDGLTNMLPNDAMERTIEEALPGGLDATARALVTEANEQGGLDNITVVLVSIEQG